MATTKGKVTTTKSVFLTLAKAIFEAEKAPLAKWTDAYREFVRNGGGSVQAFATKWASDVKGSKYDTSTVSTIRQSIALIAWAEENILGGVAACSSMAQISATRGKASTKAKREPLRKVSTVTVNETEFARKMRKAGFSDRDIAVATKALFTSK